MSITKRMFLLSLLIGAAGCAHVTMRGTVAAEVDNQHAVVCLGESEVRFGDRMDVFEDECKHTAVLAVPGSGAVRVAPSRWETLVPVCHRSRVGEGRIVDILNDHYSVLETDPGVHAKKGMVVERKGM